MLALASVRVGLAADARPIPFYLPADAGVIDVKRDAGARGDGTTDDYSRIQKAIMMALDRPSSNSTAAPPPFVYFPRGTYLVSETLQSRVSNDGPGSGWRAGLILVGEEADRTVIRLADATPGFGDPRKPKALVRTGSEAEGDNLSGGGTRAFRHSIINLTLDVGRGNPGAIALDYLTSRRGAVEDVTLRAGDGSGWCGLSLENGWPGPALAKRLTIQGFDYGIRVSHDRYSMTFEHLRLRDQRVAGLWNAWNVLTLRDVDSRTTNTAPVILASESQSHIVLLDANLQGNGPGTALVNKGRMFLRDFRCRGYATVFDDRAQKQRVPGGEAGVTLQEYVTGGIVKRFPCREESLRLPVEETPEFYSAAPADWISATARGATPDATGTNAPDDDAPGIQAAIDSGTPVVYLPHGVYHVGRTLLIRGRIRKLTGMPSVIRPRPGTRVEPLIRFLGGSAGPVVLEHLTLDGTVEHAGEPPLALRHSDFRSYRTAPNGTGRMFLEDTVGNTLTVMYRQKVWARQLSLEPGDTPRIQNRGGTLWVLGLTSVGEMTVLDATGGSTEVLGALLNPLKTGTAGVPCFVNDGGDLSLTYALCGGQYPTHVRERREGQWRTLTPGEIEGRGPALYVSRPAGAWRPSAD